MGRGGTGRESAITVNGQTRAKEFEDRVLAMDKAGEGEGKRRRHGGDVTGRTQLWYDAAVLACLCAREAWCFATVA